VKKGLQIAFIVLVSLMLIFPLCGWMLPQTRDAGMNENRNLASFPTTGTLQQRIKGIESYLSDHLALRDQLIHTVLKTDLLLGESPDSQVILGRDTWLYYAEGEKDIRREVTLNPLDRDLLIEAQTATRDLLAERGTQYVVLLAPNKQSVYPEYLPLSCQVGEGPSMMDQVQDVLKETGIRYVDTRQAMIDARQTAPAELYYRYDTHWNHTGAWYAYQELMNELETQLPTLHRVREDEFTRVEGTFNGDMAGMIGMAGEYVDHTLWYEFNEPVAEDPALSGASLIGYRNPNNPDGPVILLRHDSFGEALLPFLIHSAGTVYETDSDEITTSMLDYAQPDLVIMEHCELVALSLTAGIWDDAGEEEW